MSDVEKIRAADPNGVFHLYPADHGFNCDERGSYDAASARAGARAHARIPGGANGKQMIKLKTLRCGSKRALHRRRMARRRLRPNYRDPQPRQRRAARHRAAHGRRRNAPRHRGRARRHARLVEEDRGRTGAHHAPLVRSHAGERRRPRRHHDRRAGQAAGGVEGRDRLRGLVHRMVRRGRQTHLRRHHSRATRRTNASWCCDSPSASSPPSRRGISRPP